MQLQKLARCGSSYSRWRLTARLGLLVLGLVVARPIEALGLVVARLRRARSKIEAVHKVAWAPAIVLVVMRPRSHSGIKRGMEQRIGQRTDRSLEQSPGQRREWSRQQAEGGEGR